MNLHINIERNSKKCIYHKYRKFVYCQHLINVVFGLIIAWVLVKYEFPGKRLMDGMIELPFALPTAVAGITLSKMYAEDGMIGRYFAHFGLRFLIQGSDF